ncbi:hypothetical protein TRVL_10144 [Trypanosoma vivax]|nr:hypothetical protein TRVL_10144 [Trypanosoma vivax]
MISSDDKSKQQRWQIPQELWRRRPLNGAHQACSHAAFTGPLTPTMTTSSWLVNSNLMPDPVTVSVPHAKRLLCAHISRKLHLQSTKSAPRGPQTPLQLPSR